MAVHIRKAQGEDAAGIVRLVQELAQTAGERSPLAEDYVADYLDFTGSAVLLAEVDGEVRGLLSYALRPNLYHAGNVCLIEELVVEEQARGRGVGRALLEELFSRLRDQNCVEVSVTVLPENLGAIRFYTAHGLVDEAVYLEKHFTPLDVSFSN